MATNSRKRVIRSASWALSSPTTRAKGREMRQSADIIHIRTSGRGLIEVTAEIEEWTSAQAIDTGLLTVFLPSHFSFAADPGKRLRGRANGFGGLFRRDRAGGCGPLSPSRRRARRYARAYPQRFDGRPSFNPGDRRQTGVGNLARSLSLRAPTPVSPSRACVAYHRGVMGVQLRLIVKGRAHRAG